MVAHALRTEVRTCRFQHAQRLPEAGVVLSKSVYSGRTPYAQVHKLIDQDELILPPYLTDALLTSSPICGASIWTATWCARASRSATGTR